MSTSVSRSQAHNFLISGNTLIEIYVYGDVSKDLELDLGYAYFG